MNKNHVIHMSIVTLSLFSSALYCSLEDVHNTLNTLYDTLYKMKKSHELFLYDLMQAKTHNEFKEAVEEIIGAINGPLTSTSELITMNKCIKSIQNNLNALKTKTDVLEELRKSYLKRTTSHATTEKITTPRDVEDKDRSKDRLRTRERKTIDELNDIIAVNKRLIQEIDAVKNKTESEYDAKIYGTCSLLVTVFNMYIETVIKKATRDLRLQSR